MPGQAEANGTLSDYTPVAELEALAAKITDAVKVYKEEGAVPGSDLKYRRPIADTALELLNATKAPEEQWNEQSIKV